MRINDYLEKLRAKPERQREKIAVVATAVSFVIVFIIWLVSFNEMNRNIEPGPAVEGPAPAENLKNDLGSSAKSIQEMFEQLPSKEDLNNAENPDLNEDMINGNEESGQNTNLPDSGNNVPAENEVPELP